MKDPFPMILDKEDVRQCGRVAVWGAMLDVAMEIAIWILQGSPKMTAQERGKALAMAAGDKRKLLEPLSETVPMSSNLRDRLKAIVSDLEQAIEGRNMVIHPIWHIGQDGAMWALKRDRRGKFVSNQRFDKTAIEPIADLNKRLAVGLGRWNNAFEPGVMPASFPPVTHDN